MVAFKYFMFCAFTIATLLNGVQRKNDNNIIMSSDAGRFITRRTNYDDGDVTKRAKIRVSIKRFGFFYTTIMLEPQMYLQWLMKRVQRLGGRLKKKYINTLEELVDDNFDIIINCTGIGARKLVNDSSVQPVRGQVIRVIAPWIKTHYDFQDRQGKVFYILPGSNYVVMGGVEYQGDWNTEISTSDKKLIWDNCTKYLPSLTEAVIDSDWVGLRPARPSVRLEIENLTLKGKMMPVIHNYGHGGAGVTLHWGCAEEVSGIVADILRKAKTVLAKL